MLLLLSPAKSLDLSSKINCTRSSLPIFQKKASDLAQILKKLSTQDLQNLFGISEKLSQLNYDRYQNFIDDYNGKNSRQAILCFNGDVYSRIETDKFNEKDFDFAQDHIMILSGLYGLLRPLDLMQPYRLEMGTRLSKNKTLQQHNIKDLYDFWQNSVAQILNQGQGDIINLASNEYFSVVNPSLIKKNIIDIAFKDKKNGVLKIIGINAKRARGAMANFVIKNKITQSQDLKKFNEDGYQFANELSGDNNWVFVR